MNCDILAEGKQTHAMPRRDSEGLVVAFYPLKLATSFYGLFSGGIDATGGLDEGEVGFTHGRYFTIIGHDSADLL